MKDGNGWTPGWRHFTAPNRATPPTIPVLLALTDTQRRYKIPVDLLDQLAYGTGMDIQDGSAAGPMQRPNFKSSTAPSAISACTATAWPRLSVWFAFAYLGIAILRRKHLAENLGLAFQLTNIIRDIQEDAAMGRIYLPAEDLDRFKIAPSELRRRRFRSGCAGCWRLKRTGPANIIAPPET